MERFLAYLEGFLAHPRSLPKDAVADLKERLAIALQESAPKRLDDDRSFVAFASTPNEGLNAFAGLTSHSEPELGDAPDTDSENDETEESPQLLLSGIPKRTRRKSAIA